MVTDGVKGAANDASSRPIPLRLTESEPTAPSSSGLSNIGPDGRLPAATTPRMPTSTAGNLPAEMPTAFGSATRSSTAIGSILSAAGNGLVFPSGVFSRILCGGGGDAGRGGTTCFGPADETDCFARVRSSCSAEVNDSEFMLPMMVTTRGRGVDGAWGSPMLITTQARSRCTPVELRRNRPSGSGSARDPASSVVARWTA